MWALARSLVRSGLRQPDACVLAAAFSQQAASFSSVERVQCCVIGAGLVGLACARALAVSGKEVLLVDAASAVGTETSARHSEVIHAGIYYPPGSLKAKLCVEGKHMLYEYCQHKGVPHKQIGKLIVATSSQQKRKILEIMTRAHTSGVRDLCLLSKADVAELEPAVQCSMALLSPSTGIVDSHSYMQALLADFEAAGGTLALNTSFVSGSITDSGRKQLLLEDTGSGEQMAVECDTLVNAAGLWAQAVAAQLQGLQADSIPAQHLAKGNYFTLSGKAPFSRLVYPIPEDGGLGVHVTLDMGGQARLGPDVQWLDPPAAAQGSAQHAPDPAGSSSSSSSSSAGQGQGSPLAGQQRLQPHLPLGQAVDYSIDPQRGEAFYAAVRSYYPGLKDGSLQAAYCGVRPKLSGPGQPAADFVVSGPAAHGVPGLVNLFGIESPGLTSSLALARMVAGLV